MLVSACTGTSDEAIQNQVPSEAVAVKEAATTNETAVEKPGVALPGSGERDEVGDLLASPSLTNKQRVAAATPGAPDCPVAARIVPGEDQVVIGSIRTDGRCLITTWDLVAAADVEDRLAQLRADPSVLAADRASSGLDLSDPDRDRQWALQDLDFDALNRLPRQKMIRVAVIDGGAIDDSNPDLEGLVVERASLEIPVSSHATHIAGIIAAIVNNGNGIAGIGAGSVQLMDVPWRAFNSVSDAITFAANRGADVINLSICELATATTCSDQPNETTATAVLQARAQGVIVVAAAGNCGRDKPEQCSSRRHQTVFPAGYIGVLGVGAYDMNGVIADFSSRNDAVDVSGPGVDILSTVTQVGPDCERGACDAAKLDFMSGTSMAAPYVAGSAAVLLAARPDLHPGQIVSGLFAAARDEGVPGWDSAYGSGRIDPMATYASFPAPRRPDCPAGAITQYARVVGVEEWVRIRSEPSLQAEEIGRFDAGQGVVVFSEFTQISDNRLWIAVATSADEGGFCGWTDGDFLMGPDGRLFGLNDARLYVERALKGLEAEAMHATYTFEDPGAYAETVVPFDDQQLKDLLGELRRIGEEYGNLEVTPDLSVDPIGGSQEPGCLFGDYYHCRILISEREGRPIAAVDLSYIGDGITNAFLERFHS